MGFLTDLLICIIGSVILSWIDNIHISLFVIGYLIFNALVSIEMTIKKEKRC